MARLTAAKVKSVRPKDKAQRLGDGDGLYLVCRPNGSKAWVLRIREGGKRRDLGLGKFPTFSLKQAREKAAILREGIEQGPRAPTFREVAEQYLTVNAPTWRHPKTEPNSRSRLEARAYPVFGDKPVDQVTRRDVLSVLLPTWTSQPSASRKLRQRIRGVLDFAIAHEWTEANPAGDVLRAALPKTPAVKRHYRAMPWQEVPDALAVIEASQAKLPAKLAFRFLVLTAARSGEIRGATWTEIDVDRREWRVPPHKMKSNREHRVPLADASLEVLDRARELQNGSGLLFPSAKGRPLSDMTLTRVLRYTGLADRATVHGFRSSFRDWTLEETNASWAVAEAALSHVVGNSTEAAYARSDLFERRRCLMEEWCSFVTKD